jgi:hypothetical protein
MANRPTSASEVVRQGLRHQIQIGLDQADRGELLDGEAVFEELQRRAPRRP